MTGRVSNTGSGAQLSLPPLTAPLLPLQVDEQLGGDSTSASLATHDLSPDGWRSVVERLGWWSAEDGETSEALHRQVKRAQALLAEARREVGVVSLLPHGSGHEWRHAALFHDVGLILERLFARAFRHVCKHKSCLSLCYGTL